jgi:hypothetical protein
MYVCYATENASLEKLKDVHEEKTGEEMPKRGRMW